MRRLSDREKNIVYLLLFIIFATAVMMFVIQPLKDSADASEASLAASRDRAVGISDVLKKSSEIRKAYKATEADFKTGKNTFGKKLKKYEIQDKLNDICVNGNVTVKYMRIGEYMLAQDSSGNAMESGGDCLWKCTVSLKAGGSHKQLLLLLNSMQKFYGNMYASGFTIRGFDSSLKNSGSALITVELFAIDGLSGSIAEQLKTDIENSMREAALALEEAAEFSKPVTAATTTSEPAADTPGDAASEDITPSDNDTGEDVYADDYTESSEKDSGDDDTTTDKKNDTDNGGVIDESKYITIEG